MAQDEIFIVHLSYSPEVGIRRLVLAVLSVVLTWSELDRKPHSSSMSAWHEQGVRQGEKTMLLYSILLELIFLNVCLSYYFWNLLAFIEGYPLRKFNPCEDVS